MLDACCSFYLRENCMMASQESPATICFICEKNLQVEEIVNVTRGMGSLIKASEKYGDGKIRYIEGKESITVHKNCCNHYTKEWNV